MTKGKRFPQNTTEKVLATRVSCAGTSAAKLAWGAERALREWCPEGCALLTQTHNTEHPLPQFQGESKALLGRLKRGSKGFLASPGPSEWPVCAKTSNCSFFPSDDSLRCSPDESAYPKWQTSSPGLYLINTSIFRVSDISKVPSIRVSTPHLIPAPLHVCLCSLALSLVP